jgi:lipoate-protein ligase A
MDSWRLLIHQTRDAYTNMAIDEILLKKGTPTLRFYKWAPSAISIGYFQGIREEVNLIECQKEQVDVVRRITGGGAVYHDEIGEITYSIVAPIEYVPSNIQESYEYLCTGLIKGLQRLGAPAHFSPINDIHIGHKKISGSAQTRRYGHVLQHGTLLCSLNLDLMFRLLRVTQEKIKDKYIKNIKERVTSLEASMGPIDKDRVIKALITGFQETLHTDFKKGEMSSEEISSIPKLREKYVQTEWNFKR